MKEREHGNNNIVFLIVILVTWNAASKSVRVQLSEAIDLHDDFWM